MVKINEGGIKANPNLVADYCEFGKFIVNRKLLKENILLIKYLSYAPLPWLRRRSINDRFRTFWMDFIKQWKLNYELLRDCDTDDIKLFTKIIEKAGLTDTLDYFEPENKKASVFERFEILRGELIAGNNNPEIYDELFKVINELEAIKRITAEEKNELLEGIEEFKAGDY